MIRCFLHPASAGWFFEVDNSSAVVIKYKYDAWGNCLTLLQDIDATDIANLNPFRYRGYYYDVETKLYFLKTR